jgi:uncharacterized protein YceK
MNNFSRSVLLVLFILTLLSGCSASSGSNVTRTPSISNQVAGSLGITRDQAEAGLGAMMMLSRNKLSPDDFAALSRSFPGGGNIMINTATRLGVIPGTLGTTTDVIYAFSKLGMSYVTASNFIPAVLRITSGLDGNTYDLLSKVF